MNLMPSQNIVSMDGLHGETNSMARGSAAVQDIVNTVEQNPWLIINAFETRTSRECGALMPWQAWSTSMHADRCSENVQGHVTLKKMLKVVGHCYELCRRYPNNPEYVRAFLAQSYKVTADVLHSQGSWELGWPLLGLGDPEERASQLLTPAERIAMASLAKERKVLADVAAAAKAGRSNRTKEKDKDKTGDG